MKLLDPYPCFNDGSKPPPLPCFTESSATVPTTLPSLRTPLSKYKRHVRYCVLEFDPLLDSSSMNPERWYEIAHTIKQNYQLFDSFVVLHGTDTLAYTASALSFMFSFLGKPVIVTGSQVPMADLLTDAIDNLSGSLCMAGHFAIPEVCVYFNSQLFRGNRVTKINAIGFTGFGSPNHQPLATVGVEISINGNYIFRTTESSPFGLSPNTPATKRVACLRLFPGISAEMVLGVLKLEGVKGLILQTFGSGNAPQDPELLRVLKEGVDDGVVVVNVTQCMTGTVSRLYAAGSELAKIGVVLGMDMTTEGI